MFWLHCRIDGNRFMDRDRNIQLTLPMDVEAAGVYKTSGSEHRRIILRWGSATKLSSRYPMTIGYDLLEGDEETSIRRAMASDVQKVSVLYANVQIETNALMETRHGYQGLLRYSVPGSGLGNLAAEKRYLIVDGFLLDVTYTTTQRALQAFNKETLDGLFDRLAASVSRLQ